MNPEDFRRYLEDNHVAFGKWGSHIVDQIVVNLRDKLGYEPVPLFVKIPPVPRVKEAKSALGKIGRKKYDDPVKQMTDLVGVRFVVLLSEHIDLICDVIQSEEAWNAVTSKDYQEEIDKNPKIFDYQSQHFEVRPKDDLTLEGSLITKDMCCEVQIRTLLQHAYAELVHDSIYKPDGHVPPKAERQVAKSMALMETTDELFCSTMQLLSDANKPRNDLFVDLTYLYREKIGGHLLSPDRKTNFTVLDEFRDFFKEGLAAEISQLVERKKYISIKIASRAQSSPFFAQPASIFIYWLILEVGPDVVHRRWPLPGYWRELDVIFSDLDRRPTHL